MSRPENPLAQFDPERMAAFETAMWRDYYGIKDQDRRLLERLRGVTGLFSGLVEVCQEQFQLSRKESLRASSRLFFAAVVFGLDKKNRQGSHERISLPLIRAGYRIIKEAMGVEFDPQLAAEHELGWWQAHRASREDLSQLIPAIGKMGSLGMEIYQMPDNKGLWEAALLRLAAAVRRDEMVALRSLTEEDWREIEASLLESYSLVKETVQPQPEQLVGNSAGL